MPKIKTLFSTSGQLTITVVKEGFEPVYFIPVFDIKYTLKSPKYNLDLSFCDIENVSDELIQAYGIHKKPIEA